MKCIPVRSIPSENANRSVLNSFRIRTLREVLGGKDVVQPVHRHDFFFVLFVSRGKGRHEIDFHPFAISDRCAFFTSPGQVHSIRLMKGSEGYLLEFKEDFFTPAMYLNHVQNKNHFKFTAGVSKRLTDLFASIHHEYALGENGFRDAIKANLTLFFIELMRNQGQGRVAAVGRKYESEQLQKFLSALENDIVVHKDVSHYAARLNVSVFQLNSITKKLLGKTCGQVINERLILEAKRNLLATSSQVNKIAFDLGYADPSYFIRFFRKHTGYTPESFRQKFG